MQFSLQLSEKEQIDRAKVVLPFEHQGMEPGMRVGLAYVYTYTYTCTPTCARTHTRDMYVYVYVCAFFSVNYLTLKDQKVRFFTI